MLYVLLQVIDYMRAAVDFVAFAAVVAVVVLMVLRWVLFRVQPFGRLAQVVREWSDPMIWPVAQSLPAPNSLGIAPLFVILATLLAAFFLKWVSNDVLLALEGVVQGTIERGVSSGHRLALLRGDFGLSCVDPRSHHCFLDALSAKRAVDLVAVCAD